MRDALAAAGAIFLAGCGHTPIRPEIVAPPTDLMAPCPAPAGSAATNGQLAEWLAAYREALKQCDADKTALREWAKETR